MKKIAILAILLVPSLVHAQTHTFPAEDTNNTFTGTNIFSGSLATALAQFTVAGLPNPATTNPTREIVVVTDGQSTADCTLGGGTTPALCRTNGTTWLPLGDIFGGSFANTQIPFGSASNTFTGSANLKYVPASGGIVVNSANAGPTNVTGSILAMTNSSGTTTSYLVKGSDDSLSLRNDSLATPAHGLLRWDSVYDMLIEGGSNAPQLTLYTGNSISPYGQGSAVLEIFKTGTGTHLFSVHANTGAGDAGAIALDPFNGALTFYGDSTGNAAIQVASTAGTPNALQLPTTTGSPNQVLKTDGSNPQQLSWVTPVVSEYCGATTGATQACAKTSQTAPIIIHGDVALNTATSQSITTLPFSDGTYSCTGSDLTTAAGVVSFSSYLAASVTITETGGVNTDHLRYVCVGN